MARAIWVAVLIAVFLLGTVLILGRPATIGYATGGISCDNPEGCLECQTDADCGQSVFTGTYFCQEGNVQGDYSRARCVFVNPEISTCSREMVSVLVAVCSDEQMCVPGQQACFNKGGCPDLDRNGRVDLSDAVLMTTLGRTNATRNSSLWNEYADFDDNGIINMEDVSCSRDLIARGVLMSCPEESFLCFTCEDDVRNNNETGVDCGGPQCAACPIGESCSLNADCQTGLCVSGSCVVPITCTDTVQNGFETDIDCGGSCEACGLGKFCVDNGDCAQGQCIEGACTIPQVIVPVVTVQPSIDEEAAQGYFTVDARTVEGVSRIESLLIGDDGSSEAQETSCDGLTYCKLVYVAALRQGVEYSLTFTTTDTQGVSTITKVQQIRLGARPVIEDEPVLVEREQVTSYACDTHADCGGDVIENVCAAGLLGDAWTRTVRNRCILGEDGLQSTCVADAGEVLLQDCAADETCQEGACVPDAPELAISAVFWDPGDDLRQYGQAGLYVRVLNQGYDDATFSLEYRVVHDGGRAVVDTGTIAGKTIVTRAKQDGSSPVESLVFIMDKVFEQYGMYDVVVRVSSEEDTQWREAKESAEQFSVRKPRKLCAERFANILWCTQWAYI